MSLLKNEFIKLVRCLGVKLSKEGEDQISNTYNKVDWNRLPEKDVIDLNKKFVKYLTTQKNDRHIVQELSELIFVDIGEKEKDKLNV